ncbi:MED7 protein-domain-containing protein [Armillaria fumosa]|nr:MED7 protein-domain-containing protein [Armillaria fumosa]
MDDDEAELRNPFPSPPSHYTRYTTHNLKLLALLHERAPHEENPNQQEVLSDQVDVPDWPLKQLEKPRVDWILDEPDAYYDVFGDRWSVKETIPPLAEAGITQLYPSDPSADRRPALLSVLRSLLVTYSSLTSALLAPPLTNSSRENVEPEWKRHIDWISILSQNILAAANDLRPVQARGNLELIMKRQLELRREETATLHAKCDSLETKLAELRTSAQNSSQMNENVSLTAFQHTDIQLSGVRTDEHGPSNEDVVRWAEEL